MGNLTSSKPKFAVCLPSLILLTSFCCLGEVRRGELRKFSDLISLNLFFGDSGFVLLLFALFNCDVSNFFWFAESLFNYLGLLLRCCFLRLSGVIYPGILDSTICIWFLVYLLLLISPSSLSVSEFSFSLQASSSLLSIISNIDGSGSLFVGLIFFLGAAVFCVLIISEASLLSCLTSDSH